MRRREFLRFALTASAAVPGVALLGKACGEVHARSFQFTRGRLTGIPTGYIELDDFRNGLQPGELVLIAAPRIDHASALAGNIAQHAAVVWRRPVIYIALRRHPTEVAVDQVAMFARLDTWKVKYWRLSQEELLRAAISARQIAEAPLVIESVGSLTCLQARLRQEREAELVVVEDLQHLEELSPGKPGPRRDTTPILRALREIARGMNVPLVAAAGHCYTGAFRANERLRLRYLVPPATETVDCVLALNVDKRRCSSSPYQEGVMCEVDVLKHRDGAPGTVRLGYIPGFKRFENWCELA